MQTLITIPQNSTLKPISSYSFLDEGLKIGRFVLGTKNKSSIDQLFDLSPSEVIELLKFPPC